jgi:hypothetical protein
MSRTRKIAASLIISAGLVLSGAAAPTMAATGPAAAHAKEIKTVYYEFAKAYTKEVNPTLNAKLCEQFTTGVTNSKGQDLPTIEALIPWNDKKTDLTVNGTPWRKIVNKQHFIGLYDKLFKWRCSGPGGIPRTFK